MRELYTWDFLVLEKEILFVTKMQSVLYSKYLPSLALRSFHLQVRNAQYNKQFDDFWIEKAINQFP